MIVFLLPLVVKESLLAVQNNSGRFCSIGRTLEMWDISGNPVGLDIPQKTLRAEKYGKSCSVYANHTLQEETW